MQKAVILFTLLTSLQLHAIGCFTQKETPPPIKPPPAIEEEVVAVTPEVTLILASPFTFLSSAPTGGFPTSVTYSPNGKFAAVTNANSNTISVYRVNQHTGAFTEITGSPFEAGDGPEFISYSPCGRYAAVTNAVNSIFVYRVDATSGALSLIQTLQPPVNPEVNNPIDIVYSPDARFVAVTNFGGSNISIYKVNPITGKLSLAGPPLSITSPDIITYSPDGRFVAVTLQNVPSGATFSVDPVTGTLGNQMLFTTDNGPTGIAYSPNGKFAAVCNQFSSKITTYTVNQISGAFSLSGTINLASGLSPHLIEYTPDGTLAAAACLNGEVVFFCVDQMTGLFTQITPSLTDLAFPTDVAFHPCNDFAAVTNAGNDLVYIYRVRTSSCL